MYIKDQLTDIEKGYIVFLPCGSSCVFFKELDANKFALSATKAYDDPVFVYQIKHCDSINLAHNLYGPGYGISLVLVPRPDALPSKVYNAPKKEHKEEATK